MPFEHEDLRRRVAARRLALGLGEPTTARSEVSPGVQSRPEIHASIGRRPEHAVRRLYRAPLIGRFVRILAALYNMPVILQNLERHYADTAASLASADQGRMAAQARLERLEQSIAALTDEKRAERERLEQSVAGIIEEGRCAQALFERRLRMLDLKSDLLAEFAGVVGATGDLEHVRDVDSRIGELLSGYEPEAVLAIELDGRPSTAEARRSLAEAVVLLGGLESLGHGELERLFSASALLKGGGLLILQGLGRDLAGEPIDPVVIALLARRAGLGLQSVIKGNEGGAFAVVLKRAKRTRSAS